MSSNKDLIDSDLEGRDTLAEELLLTHRERSWLALISVIFTTVAVLAAFGKIQLSIEIVFALILAAVFSSWFIIPKTAGFFRRYVKSVKFGDLEITLFEQQTDLSKRLKRLEDRIGELQDSASEEIAQATPDSRLVARFENAARGFGGFRERRQLAVSEMTYYGVQLGADFLKIKLREGSLGEQVGAASALGELEDPTSLDSLLEALTSNSSFVRYRVARSIERLAPVLDHHQVDKAVTSLQNVITYEVNPPTNKAIRQTISTLQRVRLA